jgi:CDP-6-deoxy-D-xylo-4-hexulose-3-dehydrase
MNPKGESKQTQRELFQVDLEQLIDPNHPFAVMSLQIDLDAATAFRKKHNVRLIEDCCDALGSTYRGWRVGTFGDIATASFYPAHHLSMGKGGTVLTDQPGLKVLIDSWRDWARDCWCEPGADNTCD